MGNRDRTRGAETTAIRSGPRGAGGVPVVLTMATITRILTAMLTIVTTTRVLAAIVIVVTVVSVTE